MEEFYNSQIPPSEGPGSMSTNTLSSILPTPYFELLGKRRTCVTPYQEVQTSRSTPNQMMHLKDEDGEKSCPEDLKHWILVGRGQDRRLKLPFLIKKDDPSVPSIECKINGYSFKKTLYDIGSNDNIMAAVTYQLLHETMLLQPRYIQLQTIFRSLTWEKTSMIPPPSLEDRSSTLSKPSSILEPERSTCTSPHRRYDTSLMILTI